MHHHAMGRSRRRLGLTLRSLTAATLTASALALAPPLVAGASEPDLRPQGPCTVDAVDDGGYFTEFETQLDVPATGVLFNDTTCGLTPQYGAASSGAFSGNIDGSFTYVPAAGFTGNATVPYSLVSIDQIPIDSAIITIFVAPPPCEVNLVDDAYATPMDTALNVGAPGYGATTSRRAADRTHSCRRRRTAPWRSMPTGRSTTHPTSGSSGSTRSSTRSTCPPPTFRRVLGFFGWRAPAGAPTPDVATVTITIEAPPPTTTTPAPTTTVVPTTVPPTTVPAPTTTVATSTGSTLPATR